jgi:hypothetical protein
MVMSDAKVPWWKSLFASKAEPTAKPPSYSELVSQVAQLENMLADLGRANSTFRQRTARRSRESEEIAERYRLALEWYAKLENWRPYGLATGAIPPLVRALDDKGHRARKALGKL